MEKNLEDVTINSDLIETFKDISVRLDKAIQHNYDRKLRKSLLPEPMRK